MVATSALWHMTRAHIKGKLSVSLTRVKKPVIPQPCLNRNVWEAGLTGAINEL